MKKRYEALELEVVRFSSEDVITASVEETEPSEPAPVLLETSPDGTLGLYLFPNGHYVVMVKATGEITQDYSYDPRIRN